MKASDDENVTVCGLHLHLAQVQVSSTVCFAGAVNAQELEKKCGSAMMILEVAMNTTLKKTLLWMPRIAGILFVLFISLFAFDVFEEGLGFWGTLLALFMHLLPSSLLAIAIYVAWKREWVGAVLFIGWAIWYMVFFLDRDFPWITYAVIAGIPTVIGLLFLADWIWRKQIRTG